jgi:CheY-like chemotaxis protein
MQRSDYPDLRGRRILMVDDQPDALELLTEMLHLCGAQVVAARTTIYACAYLARYTPDLIICDFKMPGETGVEFMRWVRSLSTEHARIPAIAATGYVQEFLRATAATSLFDAYFVKPLEVPRFLGTVMALLSETSPSAPPPAG